MPAATFGLCRSSEDCAAVDHVRNTDQHLPELPVSPGHLMDTTQASVHELQRGREQLQAAPADGRNATAELFETRLDERVVYPPASRQMLPFVLSGDSGTADGPFHGDSSSARSSSETRSPPLQLQGRDPQHVCQVRSAPLALGPSRAQHTHRRGYSAFSPHLNQVGSKKSSARQTTFNRIPWRS